MDDDEPQYDSELHQPEGPTVDPRYHPAPSVPKWARDPSDLVIGTSPNRVLVVIRKDGSLVYGPDYNPEEAAVTFWETMGRRRLEYEERLLLIDHMDGILTRLGAADLHAEALRKRAESTGADADNEAAEAGIQALERVMSQAIELGRGMARRPGVAFTAVPDQVPTQIAEDEENSYDPEG